MMKWLILLFVINTIAADPTPVVLWHGMGDTCCFSFSLGSFKEWLEEQIPGIYILSIRIGNNAVEDFENGYFMNPNKQIDMACEMLKNDTKLQNGFNAIGFSQGCQFIRGVIQKCGHKIPQVKNFISLGGQHQGVYGVPNCGPLTHKSCDYVRKLLNYAAYVSWVQNGLVQATYWHDPLNEAKYKEKSIFLADINNERKINKTYVKNLKKLQHFVLVKFDEDTIVQPRETEWFGFYVPGQSTKLQTLQQSDIYIKNRLGLQEMDKSGQLVFLNSTGNHLQFKDQWFIKEIIKPYLL
ncbi:palmitoyl-protein thioesterase 1 [Pectinophora gossypiella]|uniref:palmitoyl-protein thioesterase 1 n=1 Tax=Pectinophora gossypiella TaxID=13191 RepID=UPI00214E1C43|nr:palmitoyl-protein thioesterase 1 [Pectinophora gossypiella]